ncbi:hypothetical protein F5880DRAFT_1508489 [Lentinula raphanica]|nr:hypothetical protein F5880DRAFT_1508489 [Lentinula raphanica]
MKEGVDLLVDKLDRGVGLDVDGVHKGCVVFSGTKILQANGSSAGVVLRTGFGTAQGQLVRTMISSMEQVSANNLESFLSIGFLLIFAIAAKLPMEISLAVNASLGALSKFGVTGISEKDPLVLINVREVSR